MEFDSYIDFYEHLKTFGFNDIILGVKDTIVDKTLYVSLEETKIMKFDNTSFVIGASYNLVLSVEAVDDPLVGKLANVIQSGLTMQDWSENSQLYNYVGSVYLPVGSKGETWQMD